MLRFFTSLTKLLSFGLDPLPRPRQRPCHPNTRPKSRPQNGVLEDPGGQDQSSRTTGLHASIRVKAFG